MVYTKCPAYKDLTFKQELRVFLREAKEILNTPIKELSERVKDYFLMPLGVFYDIDENDKSLIGGHKEDLENLTNKYSNNLVASKSDLDVHILAHKVRRDERGLKVLYGPIHKTHILASVKEKINENSLESFNKLRSECQLLELGYR